jgi:pullulanase
MTLPGVPCIYYGDEAGVEGWKDPFNRTCFPWGKENKEILNHYRFLTEFRKSNNVFAEGKYRCLIHNYGVFAFERSLNSQRVIIVTNMSLQPITLNLKESMKEYSSGIINDSFDVKSFDYLILI